MSFNYSKLLGKIKERGFTQKEVAKHIRINNGTLSTKLNNKSSFTADEIADICKLLDISKHEIGDYFFAE